MTWIPLIRRRIMAKRENVILSEAFFAANFRLSTIADHISNISTIAFQTNCQ